MCAISLQVPVPLVKNASLSVSMFDKLGRKFDNFSSIFVEWKSSDHSLGTVERVRDGDAEDLGQRNGYQRTFYHMMLQRCLVYAMPVACYVACSHCTVLKWPDININCSHCLFILPLF